MSSKPRRPRQSITPRLQAQLARDVGEPEPKAEHRTAATDQPNSVLQRAEPTFPDRPTPIPLPVPPTVPELPDPADLCQDRNREALLHETEKAYLLNLQRWRKQ